MAKIAKKKAAARAAFEGKANLSVEDAVRLVKDNATAKFDETVEIAMNLGVNPRHADQMVRGVVTLPAGTGKDVRVAVFARGPKADEAKEAGADIDAVKACHASGETEQIIAALSAVSLASIAQGAPSTQLSTLAAICPRPISPISCA